MVSLRHKSIFIGNVGQRDYLSFRGSIRERTLNRLDLVFRTLVFHVSLFLGFDSIARFVTVGKRKLD